MEVIGSLMAKVARLESEMIELRQQLEGHSHSFNFSLGRGLRLMVRNRVRKIRRFFMEDQLGEAFDAAFTPRK